MGFDDGRRLSGAYLAEVRATRTVTPHMVRVTLGGEDLRRMPARGFDHWFRLFLPRRDGMTDFDRVPESFGIGGYLKYLASRPGTRPPFRNYTVREHRPELGELDVEFVAHGGAGIAGPWAQRAVPGDRVALLDQGRGFDPLDGTDFVLLAGDESALPAILGILRDLPRDARGLAIIEVPSAEDVQPADAPEGVELRWLPRAGAHERPGALALAAVRAFVPERPDTIHAYLVGENAIPVEGRRHLVALGVPRRRIVFVGYWKAGRAS